MGEPNNNGKPEDTGSSPGPCAPKLPCAGTRQVWVADITYVRTLSGFAYTAFVVDVYSRKIVGVATRSTMRTDALPMEALEHALTTAGRIHGNQLIHHSDRGSQYVSLKYSTALANPESVRVWEQSAILTTMH